MYLQVVFDEESQVSRFVILGAFRLYRMVCAPHGYAMFLKTTNNT